MRDFNRPGRSAVYAGTAAIATSHPLASQVGIDVLKSGGNAMDAAIAATATMCVVEPGMTGIGGDCFALYLPKGADRPITLNGSGRSPAAATVEAIRAKGIDVLAPEMAHSVTVPGAIAAWAKLNADHGTKDMAELLAPAIRYAEDGYPIYPKVGTDWHDNRARLATDAVSSKIMLTNGQAPKIGSLHRQPQLGATLRRIAEKGRDGFYLGPVAADIVGRLNGLGAVHTLEDFAATEAEYVDPIQTTYKGHQVFECPPNGQGICALMILNIISRHDIAALSETDRIHLFAEATKLGYHERDKYISDPHQVDIPVDWLLSSEHAADLDAMIDMNAASAAQDSDFPTHKDTIYMSCVDADGNAVSFINSLFSAFGSTIMAPESGVMLHNRGRHFKLFEGHVNSLAPNKRPMHTIIPGMVMMDGKAAATFGVMGGQYQSTGHATFLSNVLARGMDVQTAIDDSRHFATDGVLQLEPTLAPETYGNLISRGHDLERVTKPLGGGQCVWFDHDAGVLIAGSDPRKDGCALGY
jgi:gamma-glutamyltranspeptidase/glutathione hydrolase